MSVKSTTSNKITSTPYPKLMGTHGGLIVLFCRPKCGTVVVQINPSATVGYYSEDWEMSHFTDYMGSVTLENSND